MLAADYDDYTEFEPEELPEDAREREAREELEEFFEKNHDKVFFSRQLEVQCEGNIFIGLQIELCEVCVKRECLNRKNVSWPLEAA